MYCPNCGEKLPEGARFCGACGSRLEESFITDTGEAAPAEEVNVLTDVGKAAASSMTETEMPSVPSHEANPVMPKGEDLQGGCEQRDHSASKPRNRNVLPVILIVAVIAVIIAVNVVIAVMPTAEERWQEQYDLGQQYLLELDYEQAIVAFTKAIQIDGNNADAYIGRAEAYLGSDVLETSEENLYLALSDYETSLSLGSEDASVYVSLGNVYLALGQEDEALAGYERALELETVPEEVYINVARIYIGMDRLEEAVILLDEASNSYPESEEIETVWEEASYDPFDFGELSLEVWDGSVASGFSGGDGSLSSPWQISNGAELAYFAEYAATSEGADDYYILTANIQMNDLDDWENWLENPPANEYKGDIEFSGDFDGAGYTIYGLYSRTGLMQCLSPGATVWGVHLVGCMTVGEDRDAAGGICSEIYGTRSDQILIDSCSFSGIVTGCNAGGIAGELDSKGEVTIQHCTVRGSVISDTESAGGIIGHAEGNAQEVKLRYCVNYSAVRGVIAGGVIGNYYDAYATISHCGNLGTVTTYSEKTSDSKYGGGIIGELDVKSVTISDCFNSGKIIEEGDTYYSISRGVIGLYSSGISASLTVRDTVYRDGVSADNLVHDSASYYNAGMYEILTESNVSRLSLTELMEAGYPIVDRGDDTVMPWDRSSVSDAEEDTEVDMSGADASEEPTSADEESDTEDDEAAEDDEEEEGTESTQTDAETVDWASVYLELLSQVSITTNIFGEDVYFFGDNENSTYSGFSLLYIDDDDIPEMVMHGEYEATGNLIYIVGQDGSLNREVTGRLFFSYVERGNILINSDGHQGLYYDRVYSIEDGQLVLQASGSYVTNQEETVYTWNDVSVTEEEYNELLGQYTSGVTLTDNDYEPDYTLEELTVYLSEQ